MQRDPRGPLALVVVVAAVACWCSPLAARAELKPAAPEPPELKRPEGSLRLGHYSTASGLIGLVIDRTRQPPLLRLDGLPELFVLTPESLGRDGHRFKGDDGHTWLISDGSARVTLFTDEEPRGVRVFRDADARRLVEQAAPTTQEGVALHGRQTMTAVNKELGTRVTLQLALDGSDDLPSMAAAVDNVARALRAVGGDDLGLQALRKKLRQVSIRRGRQPSARYERGALRMELKPGGGPAGRPSSRRLKQVLVNGL